MRFFFILFIGILILGNIGNLSAQEPVEVSKQEVTSFTYACLPYQGDYKDHETVITNFINATIAQDISPLSPLLGIYYNNPQTTKPENLKWEIGFQVADTVKVESPLVLKKWEHTSVAKATHVGPYEKSAIIYPQIFKWISQHQLIPKGPVMERFLDDPDKVKPEELKTEIWIPLLEKTP